MAAKAPGDAKAPDQPTAGQMTTPSDTQKQQKNLEKDKATSKTEEPETKDTKPTAKKGIQESTPTITAKDEKRESQKSRYYEVRNIICSSFLLAIN